MKKVLSIVLMLVLLTGCGGTNHKENVVKKYKEYFDYSLGDYSYNYEETDDNGGGSGGFTWNNYRVYNITYKDSNYNKRTIKISNYYSDFNNEILYAVNSILNEEVHKLFNKRESKYIKDKTMYNDLYVSFIRLDDNKELYDSTSGVKFSDLTINNIEENNLRLVLTLDLILSDPLDEVPELNDEIIKYVKFIYDEYNLKNTIVKVNIRPKEANNEKKLTITYNNGEYNIVTK